MNDMKQLQEVYNKINNDFINNPSKFNTSETQTELKRKLEKLLDFDVTCDATNNPPEVITACCIVATIRKHDAKTKEILFSHLIFGRPEQVDKVRHLFSVHHGISYRRLLHQKIEEAENLKSMQTITEAFKK